MPHETQDGGFLLSDDSGLLDLDAVHAALNATSWASGMPREVLLLAIRNSVAFGAYHQAAGVARRQAGFARVVTDRSTFAYLTDMVVFEGYRGHGLGTRLMRHVLAHPDLQGLRRFSLLTPDAQAFYEPLGFSYLSNPRHYMERAAPDVYRTIG